MVKGLELLSLEARLRKLGLFSLKKGKLGGRGDPVGMYKYLFWGGGGMKMEANASQRCPVKGHEATDTDWHIGNCL